MDLYKISKNSLESIKSDQFKLEKDIQSLVESNLEALFKLKMVSTEFSVGDFRLDTLCYDEESTSFVIIEYKRGSSYSVIDQGYSYLSVMLNNKAEFILEYNEVFDIPLKRSDIDWSSSRVIFISPSFNTYQRNSVNFKDVPFELWEIKRFEGGLVSLEQLQSDSDESVEKITGSDKESLISQVSKEVKVYSESDHTRKGTDGVIEIWREIRSRFEDLPSVRIFATKMYIGMKKEGKLFSAVRFYRNHLLIDFNRGDIKPGGAKSKGFFDLEDPKAMSTKRQWTYKSGVVGNAYVIKIENISDLEYIVYLIQQKYESIG